MTSNEGNSTMVCGGVKQFFSLFPIQSYWYLTFLTHSYNIISESWCHNKHDVKHLMADVDWVHVLLLHHIAVNTAKKSPLGRYSFVHGVKCSSV